MRPNQQRDEQEESCGRWRQARRMTSGQQRWGAGADGRSLFTALNALYCAPEAGARLTEIDGVAIRFTGSSHTDRGV